MNHMLLKRSTGFVFGYQILKHFLKCGPILPGRTESDEYPPCLKAGGLILTRAIIMYSTYYSCTIN